MTFKVYNLMEGKIMDEKEKIVKEIEALCENFMNDFGKMVAKIREKDYDGAKKIIKKQ